MDSSNRRYTTRSISDGNTAGTALSPAPGLGAERRSGWGGGAWHRAPRRRAPATACTVGASNPEEGRTKCPTTHSHAFAQSCKSGLTRHRKRYLACALRSMPSIAGAQAPPAVRRPTPATRQSRSLPRWRMPARSRPGEEERSERGARQRPQVARSEVHRGRDAGRCSEHRAARTERASSRPLSGCPALRRLKSGPQPASRVPLYREK
jgi:hypothetical protein